MSGILILGVVEQPLKEQGSRYGSAEEYYLYQPIRPEIVIVHTNTEAENGYDCDKK